MSYKNGLTIGPCGIPHFTAFSAALCKSLGKCHALFSSYASIANESQA